MTLPGVPMSSAIYKDDPPSQSPDFGGTWIVMEGRSLTAAEIRWELRRAKGVDVPESTINGQLHSLSTPATSPTTTPKTGHAGSPAG